jgi:hypothetical protein
MFAAAAACSFVACNPDGVQGDDDGPDRPDAGDDSDAPVGDTPCDMSGRWIAEQHVTSVALGADQDTTTWYYYEITQEGDTFTITKGLNCGLVVDGTASVGIDDATLEALASMESAGPGRQGTFRESGGMCEFKLDRSYNLRGANKNTFLLDVWQVGDEPKPLSEFPALPTEPPGMEDWDGDNMHGITLRSGLGNRDACQRDWNEHEGTVPQFAAQFGGDGVITVTWDSQEGISDQTTPILRVTATPQPPGWARYARAPGLPEGGTDLELCQAVQDLAAETWPP